MNPLGLNLNKTFSVFLILFFIINLIAYQNQTIPLFWKVLVCGLAFSGIIALVFASDYLAEINKKNWRYKT